MGEAFHDRPLRVGIVGAGYVSTYHLRALKSLSRVNVVGIADSDPERARKAAADFGVPQVFPSLAAMAEARPDVVHILTPPASHCPLTLQALEMGCHVLVEKPMALSVEDCDRMIAQAHQAGRVLSVDHSAKFSPVLQRALKLVQQGAIGDVLAVDYIRGSGYPPCGPGPLPAHYDDGGYPYRDIGVHGLYLIEAFLGEIENVTTEYRASGRDPYLMFDEWRSQVRTARGSAQMYLSWNSRPMQNELLVQGTQGCLRLDLFFETLLMRRNLPGPKVAELVFGNLFNALSHIRQVCWNTVRFATRRLLPSQDINDSVVAFANSLLAGEAPPVSAEEGRRMVLWAEQATRPADREKQTRLQPVTRPKPARILITGASGFLGSVLRHRVLETLPEGETVRLLVRPRTGSPLPADERLELVYGDLGDSRAVDAAMQGIELVYHVGATMNGCWEEFDRGTVSGTRNMVEACRKHGVRRMVHISSLSVLDYATLSEKDVVSENAALEPRPTERGFYAQSKLEAENIVLQAIRESNFPAVVLRPGQIFGPGAEMIPPYGTVGVGSRWVIMGNGSLPLPLVYVDDVADAILLAGRQPGVEGLLAQLVDPSMVTQREFAAATQHKLRGRVKVSYAPLWFLYLAATGLEVLGKLLGRRVPLTFYRLRSVKGIRTFDCSVARDRLGWTPRVGVREGLRRTYQE